MVKLLKIDFVNIFYFEILVVIKMFIKIFLVFVIRLVVFVFNVVFNFLKKIIEMCYLKKKKKSYYLFKLKFGLLIFFWKVFKLYLWWFIVFRFSIYSIFYYKDRVIISVINLNIVDF